MSDRRQQEQEQQRYELEKLIVKMEKQVVRGDALMQIIESEKSTNQTTQEYENERH